MKKHLYILFILVASVFGGNNLFAVSSENFENTTNYPTATVATTNASASLLPYALCKVQRGTTYSGTSGTDDYSYIEFTASGSTSGVTSYIELPSSDLTYLQAGGTLTIRGKQVTSSTGRKLRVFGYNTSTSKWVQIGSDATVTTSWADYSFTISANTYTRFAISGNNASGVGVSKVTWPASSCTAPTITTEPATATASYCVGTTATALSVSTSASSPTYQWYSSALGGTTDTVAISGATLASYTPATTTAGTSYYLCKVTSGGCSTMSTASGLITVNALPTITSVTDGSICGTGTATLGATASAGTINWYLASTGGTSQGTGTAFTTPTISTTTNYYVDATNNGCTTASRDTVTATVASGSVAGTASASPTSICSGSSSTLTLTGYTGNIQWQSSADGTTYTNISGATSATYSASPTATTYYRAAVTFGSCTTVYSPAITITVGSLTIGTQPSTSTQSVCINGSVTALSVVATGATSYQWYSNTSASNSGGTSLGTGATSASYTPSNTTAGTLYYYCVVGNATCSVASSVSGAITINAATAITTQPSSTSANVGGTATLTVVASGAGTLTYQWYSNTSASNSGGTAVTTGSGGTTATYTPVTTTAGTYYYYCIVTGTCGTATTNAVTLTVTSTSTSIIVPTAVTNGCNTLSWTCVDASTTSFDVKICSGTASDVSISTTGWSSAPSSTTYNYLYKNCGYATKSSVTCLYLGGSSNVVTTGTIFDNTAVSGYLIFDLANGARTISVTRNRDINIYKSIDGGTTWTSIYTGTGSTSDTYSTITATVNEENAVKIKIINEYSSWSFISTITTTNFTGCTTYNTGSTARSYTPTGLSANTTYYVAVKNNEGASSSNWSSVLSYYTAPDAPTITSVSAAANSITLNWTMPSGSNSLVFGISYKPSSSSTWTTFSSSYTGVTATITGLSASTSYDYRIKVYGPVCSNVVSGTINTAPAAPVPTSSNPTTSGFKVSWPAVSNVDGYEVKVCKVDTTGSTYSLNTSVTTANGWATIPNTMTGTCSYTGVMPSSNSAYQSTIYENGFSLTNAKVSTDCQGIMTYLSSSQIVTPVLTSAHTLSFKAAGYASGYTIAVYTSIDGGSTWTSVKTLTCSQQWTSSTALASFSVPINIMTPVMIKLVPNGGYMFFSDIKVTDALSCNTVSSITSTSYTPAGLDPNTKYYYAVRSYKNNSGTYSYSDWSTVSSSTAQVTLQNAPTCGTPSTTDVSSGFNAKWVAPSVTGGSETYTYAVQLQDSAGNAIGSAVSVPSTGTAYNFTSVNGNTTYKYQVWSVNAGGESDTISCGPITTPISRTLTVTVSPTGGGTVAANGTALTSGTTYNYTLNQNVVLTATPASGYSFLRWVINDTRYTDNPYTLEITDNMTVTAIFAAQTCTTTDFDDLTSTNLATGSYKTQSVTIDGASWDVVIARLSTSNYHTSSNCIRLAYPASGDTSSIISPITVTPASVSFYARTSSSAGKAYIYLSQDGGTTYKYVAQQAVTTTHAQYTVPITATSSYCRIKIANASTTGSTGYDMYIDDITICGAPDGTPPAITFYPTTGSTEVPIDTILTITSDEKLYYYTSTGTYEELTSTVLSDASVLSRLFSLTKYSNDSSIAFTATISSDGKVITITHTNNLSYSTQYKLSVKYLADANENMLASTLYTLFTTEGVPEPRISAKDNATHTSYANGSTYNMGTLISGSAISSIFKVYNTGSDPLIISSSSITGTGYSISSALSKTTINKGDSASITVTFTPSAVGTFTGKLSFVSNDLTNTPYEINLTAMKATFVLPYTYQSGCTSPVVTSSELTHDYASTTDIPSQIQIGNLSSSSAVTTSNFNPAYSLFHVEGNCMTDGNSALRVGSGKKSLVLDLDSCGQITFKWCASGYRKLSVTDASGNVYLQSSTWLEGSTCYTNSVVINSCAHNRIMISFEASDSTILSTLYYLNITKCSAELKSSAKDIVDYSFGITGEKVRIYDNYIFVTLPATYSGSLSTLTPTVIEASPKATVTKTTTGDTFADSTMTYTVTAEDGTTKTYTVSLEVETAHNNYYSNVIELPVEMNEADKKLSVLEISNTTCTVPSTGDGSSYTIHFLDPTDKPVGGYKISGLTKLCVGSKATYTLSNAPEANNPSYAWNLAGTSASLFTIVGGTTGSSLTILAPTTVTDSVELKLAISVNFNADECQWTTGGDTINIQVTKTSPDQVNSIDGGCLSNGYLTLTAHGAGASATTYNWNFSPSTTQISSQNDSTIVLNIGSSVNDIYATINTQNGCGITKGTTTFPVDYATAATTWKGGTSSDWNTSSNWTARVPKACTNVTIPDVSVTGVAYPTITGTGECNYITFEPGAAVLGLQNLTYNKAFVKVDLERNKWYTLTAPLKNMYSGDYYFSAGAPVTYMRLFDAINPDSLNTGSKYVGTWTRTFANLKVALTPGSGFAYNIDSTVWNYPNGKNYTHTNKTLTFPRMNSDSSLITKYIPYASLTGKPLTSKATTVDRYDSIAYRLAMENNNNVLSDVTISLNSGLNLVGNPLMTHLDVAKLLTHNSSISSTFRFWDGSTFVTYTSTGVGTGIWSDASYSGTLIAPMQSFIVNAATTGSLTFKLNSDFAADAAKTSKLRAATTTENLMHITSSNGTTTSSTAITKNSNATNSYKSSEDAFKLFTSITSVPDVYTLADGVALDINQFKEVPYTAPLAIKTTQYGKTTLTFNGAESFGDDVDVSLINTATSENINLKEQSTYSFTLDSTNAEGTLYVQFKVATVTNNEEQTTTSSIQIYTKDNNVIRVISSPTNLIKDITIMDETGKKIVEKSGLSTSLFDMVMNNGDHVYIVRAVTEKEVKIAKVLIK